MSNIFIFPLFDSIFPPTMSTQPAHQIWLPAEYLDADETVLTSCHQSVTSSVSDLLGPSPSDFDVASSDSSPAPLPSTQPSAKRSCAPLLLDDDTDTTDVPDSAPKTKKLKKTQNLIPSARGLQNEVSIISIDDVDDLKSERLNKSCYVLVERSARRERDGYDSDTLHIVLEACASDTL